MTRRCHLPHAAAVGLLVAALAGWVGIAQAAPPNPPPAVAGDTPLPPPVLDPLPDITSDVELQPQVTIKHRDNGETVEEARIHGRIVWIKVTPSHGRSYYLIPTLSGNTYVRRDSLESGLSVPMWVLFTF